MPRREFEGVVVSDKSDKTVIVKVERVEMNPIYKKFLKSTRKFAAHDEENKFKAGDVVRIQECPPISKRKKWIVIT
jgi:small subunit ribosomal protein S17